MSHKSIHRNYLAYFPEVTPCVAPADWAASGVAIEFTGLDTGGIKQGILDNPTLERRIQSVNKRKKIRGIRNCEFTASLKLHGTGTTVAADAQAVATYLGDILEHCMGGRVLGYSTTCIVGSTAAIPILDDVSNLVVGQTLAFEDITSPTGKNRGKLFHRQIKSIDGGTGAVTLAVALPFTPVATDPAHATELNYTDENVLEDAVGSGSGGTWQWYIQRAKTGTDLLWQVEGSVASFSLTNLGRGQLPGIDLKVQAANFRHGAADGLAFVDMASPVGNAQLSMGIDVYCTITPYNNTALVEYDVNAASFDVGYERERVATTTEVIDRFEGTATYSMKPGNTRFTCTIVPYANAWYAALEAGQEYCIQFSQPGDGSGAGKSWSLIIPRAQLVETPGRSDVNEVHGVTLVFEAMEPDNIDTDANEELEKAVFLISRA